VQVRRLARLAILLVPAVLALAAGPARAQLPPTETVELVNGCTNVSLTWPAGTAVAVVVGAVSPGGSVRAIWKFDAPSQQFLAWSVEAPQASNLTTVNPLDAVFICATAAGLLTRPVLGTTSTTPVTVAPVLVPAAPFVPPVRIIAVSEMTWRGGSAYITVAAPPGTACDIVYAPPPGSPPSTTGLGPRKVDQTGQVTWFWTVPLNTIPGTAGVAIACAGVTLNAIIRIT
jgi:hypothetical protein